jgi:hypothetical protein
MSEDTTQIEDVQEDTLVEETEQDTAEVVEETAEVSAEDSIKQDSLSETVLKTLLGESEEEEVIEEAKHAKKDDEEEVDEAKEEDDEDEDKEDVDEAKEEDDDEDEEIDEDSHDGDEDEDEEEAPKTKAEILNQMYKEMKGMKKSQLHAAYGKLHAMYMTKKEEVDGEKEGDEIATTVKKSADAAKNMNKGDLLQAAYKMMKSQKKASLQAQYGKLKKEMASAKSMDESFDLESEVDLLVQADANLSEEFKTKAQVVFEAAIANKVYDIRSQLEEQYASDLQEELGHVRTSLIEKIDNYLTYVVENWVNENEDVVDSQLRSEITEGFIKGLQTLFTESYIDVPEEKRDLVSELDEKVKLIEGSLEQAESDKEDLEEKLEDLLREKIIRESSEDLTSTQVEKLNQLLDGAEFVSEESFTEKVATVKETFFSQEKEEEITESTSTEKVEVIVEGQGEEKKAALSPDMSAYIKAMTAMEKNSSIIKQ